MGSTSDADRRGRMMAMSSQLDSVSSSAEETYEQLQLRMQLMMEKKQALEKRRRGSPPETLIHILLEHCPGLCFVFPSLLQHTNTRARASSLNTHFLHRVLIFFQKKWLQKPLHPRNDLPAPWWLSVRRFLFSPLGRGVGGVLEDHIVIHAK